ncbi:MAG TPA: ATP-binding protein, partial [Bacteroidota bacterium]|nr:ATP-binding protein [Bacteroidota bacterium]
GEITHYLGVKEDISEQRKAREREREQGLQLRQADKMASLGILVAGVAHEINNPNNLVMFNSDLIAQSFKDVFPVLEDYYTTHPDETLGGLPFQETRKEMESLLKGLSIGAQRIRDIVSSLKEFARIDAGNLNQEVKVNDVIRAALLIVGNLIKKSTDHFTIELDEEIRPIRGNTQQIEQVLINLVTNACHALPNRAGGIHIRSVHDRQNARVKVIVSDQGIGIPPELMGRLFDPFFTTKRDQGGTGLGLSVSYNIVQAHRGDLIVESEPGKGTTVTLSLPSELNAEV